LEGSQAAESACRIAASLGADLWSHRSQFLTPELASRADYIVTMTQGHVQILTQSYHSLGCQPRLLNPRGEDIADPIGYGEDIYRICANQILESLQPLLQEVCSGLR